jgi:hypothetical protein
MLKPVPELVKLLKGKGERLLRDFGVENVRWVESETPKGHRLIAMGTRHTAAGPITMTTTFS